MKKKTIIITAIAAIFAIAATIFVVKKGPQLKEDLLEKVDELKAKVKDFEVSEVKDALQAKLVEIKEDIKAFDWEKSKEEVEKKFYEFKKQIRSVKKHMPLIEEENEETSLIEDEELVAE